MDRKGLYYHFYLAAVPLGAVLVYFSPVLHTLLVLFCAISLGVWFAIRWVDNTNPVEGRVDSRETLKSSLFHIFANNKFENPQLDNCFKSRLLISKTVDSVLDDLIEYTLRDFIFAWYNELVPEDKFNLNLRLKNELWLVVSQALTRLRSIDQVSFFTKDLVERLAKHVRKINHYHHSKVAYELSAHLKNEEAELNFLRKVSDLLLHLLLPQCYLNIKPLYNLLREIVAVQVLFNTIAMLSDPDYLNQKLLEYIKQEEESSRHSKTKYAYAETYDEFVDMIKHSNDVDDLKRMRYYIVTEIMQSTAINNFKKERGIDQNREGRPLPGQGVKGDHLMSRNLPRYINQLRYAKRLCESRIKALSSDSRHEGDRDHPPSKVFLGFTVIMTTPQARQYFFKFLQMSLSNRQSAAEKSAMYLVLFWESVDEMRKAESVRQFELANQLLYHSYFLDSIKNHIKFPPEIRNEMEQFIMGNTGPDAFYKTQQVVYRILEERYYPKFIVSKDHDELMQRSDELGLTSQATEAVEEADQSTEERVLGAAALPPITEGVHTIIDEHISFAKQTLQKLKKTLSGKTDALTALRKATDESSIPISQSDTLRINKLTREVKDINEEIHQTDSHVQRSLLWLRHLTNWRAELYSILPEENPMAMVLVHHSQEDTNSDGWVVTRPITEIIELKRKLSKIKPSLKKIEILRLKNVSEDNRQIMNKATNSLNDFLGQILSDEECCKSEELYLFLIPSADYLRNPLSVLKNPQTGKTSTLPFASFFGISSGSQNYNKQISNDEQQSDEELSRYLADPDRDKENQKDDIAEPAYALLDEIFDLHDNAGWLRKSLIAFVQISFGQTINKQIRETVSWLSSESMTYYYICQFRDSVWPNGKLAESAPEREKSDKDQAYVEAKQKLAQNIPDFLSNLLGVQNARKGMSKNEQLNRQLLYELLEAFLLALVPELQKSNVSSASPTASL